MAKANTDVISNGATVLDTATNNAATGTTGTVESATSTESTTATETTQAKVKKAEFTPVAFQSPIKGIVYGMESGEHLVFENGQFTAKTEAQFNFLKNHPDYGRSLFLLKGQSGG